MGTFLKTTMGKKTQELRQKDKKELESLLEEHREQLAQLRIEQQSSGNATKLSKIREVRKKYQKGKDARHRPRDLRQKKTRAIRLALKPSEANKKTKRALIKHNNFPQRKYAIKA